MRYGSICSGIEAASVAWEPLGWTPAWFAEIEPFPSAVLAHRYPGVPNLGDMTKLAGRILAGEVEAPDVLVGGTPCQAFSVAGLRKGLADERGKLTPAFALLADAIDTVRANQGKPPVIVVWENVPGVLSDKDNAYGSFLGLLAGEDGELQPPGGRWTNAGLVLGPSRQVAWRVLDAQYFGVAQRRRRVFLVASARTSRVHPVQVLLVEAGVRRDPPTRGAAREDATAAPGRGAASGGELDQPICGALTAGFGKMGAPEIDAYTALPVVVGALSDGAQRGGGLNGQDAYTGRILPVTPQQSVKGDRTHALKAEGADGSEDGTGRGTPIVNAGMAVRRLTPVECERLQGFPDNYTRIPWKKRENCPDGPRYKALGNSMAVPCMAWLGRRIDNINRSTP